MCIMSSESVLEHFLYIKKKKYKTQRKALKRFIRKNPFRVAVDYKASEKEILKYWANRKRIFRLFETGKIHLTRELWYSVTPELVAKFIARFVKSCIPNAKIILDVFCGGGGNSIQFAKLFDKVYGVDFKMEHLFCSYKNAEVYGVADRLWLKYGDWIKLAKKGIFEDIGVDFIFASPPWGGPNYATHKVFAWEQNLIPVGLTAMLETFFRITDKIALFLPYNSDLKQISKAAAHFLGPNSKCKVLYVRANGILKGIVCFLGKEFYTYDTIQDQVQELNNVEKEDNIIQTGPMSSSRDKLP